MSYSKSQLSKVAELLREGEPSPSIAVRTFISWFFAERRGYRIVQHIRKELKEAGLKTVPNFEYAWIDAKITFELISDDSAEDAADQNPDEATVEVTEGNDVDASPPVWVSKEATYRISRLGAANQSVVAANPDDSLPAVITKMMAGGFSQLPIMQNERDVKGIISWQSIGSRLALGVGGTKARELGEPHQEIRSDRSIFEAIPIILAHDYVLVRDEKMIVSGIITAADLSVQFRELTEPFLLLSEIENLLRNLIGDRFSADELTESSETSDSNRGPITSVSDLSFGEYIRLLQNPDRWSRLDLAVDRVMFCDKLDQVRQIRNDVMHFDPDGVGETELTQLREFTRFMQQLMTLLGRTT